MDAFLNPERRFLIERIKFDKKIVSARGHYLYDEEGNSYLDFLSQYGAVPFGYNPPALWAALEGIRHRLEPSFVQPLISGAAESLAAELAAVAPNRLRYVTFTNSGAESVEAAIKLARSGSRRKKILSTATGFHGKTSGAVCATGNSIYRDPFLIDADSFEHIAYNDLERLEECLAKRDFAAFIVEPVQGESGMLTPDPGYLSTAARLCRKYGTFFVLDEVQTGLGRTGRLFAAERQNLEVDILLLAKALGGGLVPLGACLCSERVWNEDFGYYHSSTFANNHLTCSVGLATLRLLLENDRALIRQVEKRGAYLRRGLESLLQRYPKVFAVVSGEGLMQGLHLKPWNGENSYYVAYASDTGYALPLVCGYLLNKHRILTAPAFNNSSVLRLEPPLTIEQEEIDRLLSALETTAKLLQREDYATLFGYLTGPTEARSTVPVHIDFAESAHAPVIPPREGEKRLGSFAFLIHPPEFEDLLRTGPKSIKHYNEEQFSAWSHWLASSTRKKYEPGVVYYMPAIRSKAGGYASGWLIGSPLTSLEMMKLGKRERQKLISQFIEVARKLGVDIVGLGGFISIITRGGIEIANCGVQITTGNSLTAVAAVESLEMAARVRGLDLHDAKVGVIGAAGSVGRLVCKLLVPMCTQIVLFGNPRNPNALKNLEILAGELYRDAILLWLRSDIKGVAQALSAARLSPNSIPAPLDRIDEESLRELMRFVQGHFRMAGGMTPPIQVTADLASRLSQMNAVISAANQTQAFVEPELLAPRAIICDAARPLSVPPGVRQQRSDVFVYEGGLMKLPEPVNFGTDNVLGFPCGINLACLSEAIVLAMSRARHNYSIGNRISMSEAQEIYALSRHHGFEVALLNGNGELLSEAAGRVGTSSLAAKEAL